MAYEGMAVLGKNTQMFPLTFGEILVRLIKNRFPHSSTAKMAESVWGLDPKTSRNLVSEQVCSSTTLLKAALTEQEKSRTGWDLWDAIGEALFGETRAQYDERKLKALIEAVNAQQQVVQLSAWRGLDASPAELVRLVAGEAALPGGNPAGQDGRQADVLGREPAVNPAPQVGRGARR